ncbi:hypothetical protein PC9H_006835 [Pleurotus ostreatus]|uniref:Uncharacterized protein n=1 Tax=Pleurotus ostreatus TaxID=5322 RepID=A0A8H7DRV5_PLEOS|nr:uncharacterized protein PC9H_006835 [Pleurotus ostreatus]KAF7431115.1 hypothetical protein PC9H_006835 [Pleurotus ostreatus]KAJ8695521.1 hypothetical protein PTI98_008124 [Pleurotus ostreatus]
MSASIQIKHTSVQLPECKVNLMPFHLNHDGPAPISTYFMVDAAKEAIGAPSGTNKTDSTVSDTQDDTTGSKTNAPSDSRMNVDGHLSSTVLEDKTASSSSSKTRFISTFRGRTIQGLNVELPTGYVGVVLKPKESSEGERKNVRDERAEGGESSTGRVTRGSSKAQGGKKSKKPVEEEQEEHGIPPDLDENAKRILVPTSSFSSFVIWHPDIPVDEGRDEYYRTLKEWTQLASVLHREE